MRAVLVAATVVVALAAPAQAQERLDTAYWWVGQQDGSAPPPATVPSGGVYVAANAAGATAVSGIRVTLDPGEQLESLSLTTHQVQKVDALSIDAYVTDVPWKAGDAQAWSTAPTVPTGAVAMPGVVQPDGLTLTFDLRAARCGAVCSLLLVPGPPHDAPTAGIAPTATFDATFEKPTVEALGLTRDAVTVPSAPAGGPAATPVVAAPPPVVGALVPPLPAAPAVTAPAPVALTPEPEVVTTVGSAAPALRPSGRSGRETAVLALLLAVAAFWLGWRARAALLDGTPRTTIYDLPPDA